MTVNDELDALPLELLDLPELTEETLKATPINSEQFFPSRGEGHQLFGYFEGVERGGIH